MAPSPSGVKVVVPAGVWVPARANAPSGWGPDFGRVALLPRAPLWGWPAWHKMTRPIFGTGKGSTVTVKVGVIGTGIMGADHANTLHRYVSGAAVTVVTDADLKRAEKVAAGIPGARVARSGSEVIDDTEVDAVVIASPDPTHADFTIAAIRARKAVMCEKPLALTLADCQRVMAVEEEILTEAQVRLISMGFMRRFDPGYVQMKASIDAHALGLPLLVHCVSRGVSSSPGTTSEIAIKASAVHEFDIVPWLLGEPIVDVSWHAPRRSGLALQDPQVMLLRTVNDVLVTVETFLNAGYGYDIRCEVVGESATIALGRAAVVVSNADSRRFIAHSADWRPRFADAYRLELQAWVDAIAAGRPSPLATAADGLNAAVVAEAVITSMNTGGMTVGVEVPSGRA